MLKKLISLAVLALLSANPLMAVAAEQDFLTGAWDTEQTQGILDKTLHLRLPYDADSFSKAERKAVVELIAAGKRMHHLYLDQVHHQGVAAALFWRWMLKPEGKTSTRRK
jgi:hypothetical protein